MGDRYAERSTLIGTRRAVSSCLTDRTSPGGSWRAVVVDGHTADSVEEGTSRAVDGRS